MLTYGDGVADVDIAKLLEFHRAHGKLGDDHRRPAARPVRRRSRSTTTRRRAASSPRVSAPSRRSPIGDGAWVNGGFFVLEPAVLDRIDGDDVLFEREPLEGLAADGELRAFRHRGFWQPMDALRDLRVLEALWESRRGAVGRVGRTDDLDQGRRANSQARSTVQAVPCLRVDRRTSPVPAALRGLRGGKHHRRLRRRRVPDVRHVLRSRAFPTKQRFSEYYGQSSKYDLSAEGAERLRVRCRAIPRRGGVHRCARPRSRRPGPRHRHRDRGLARGPARPRLHERPRRRTIARAPRSMARDVHGLDVIAGDARAARSLERRFAVVSLVAVLEHSSIPPRTLRESIDLLRPDGLLYLLRAGRRAVPRITLTRRTSSSASSTSTTSRSHP